MFRVASLGSMPDQKLDRLVRRVAFLLVLGTVAFGAFYMLDRHPMAGPSLIDRQIARAEDEVRTAPDNIPARMALAGLYLSSERWDPAADQFGQILTIQADHKMALLGRGTALYLKGDLAGAEPMYQQLVDTMKGAEFTMVDPSVQEAHYYLGLIAAQTDRPDRAISEYQTALQMEPTDADASYQLGMTYLQQSRPGDAIEPLRASTLFVPLEWTDPYIGLQDAYTRLDMPRDATWAAGMIALTKGEYADGRDILLTVAGDDASIDVLTGLGYATEAMGDTATALEWWKKALARDPDSFSAQQGVGRLAEPDDPILAPLKAADEAAQDAADAVDPGIDQLLPAGHGAIPADGAAVDDQALPAGHPTPAPSEAPEARPDEVDSNGTASLAGAAR